MVIDSNPIPIFLYSVQVPSKIRWKGGITKWLLENIGIVNQDWEYSWYLNELWFKSEEDRVKFILRWL